MSDMKTVLNTGSTSVVDPGIAEALARNGRDLVNNGMETADDLEPLRTRIECLSGGKVFS